MRRWQQHLIGPAILFAITVGMFWKLLLTKQYTWLNTPDLVNQVLPWFQVQAVEWHQGRFPLWDPHHWGGQSLIGQGQPGAAYPPNWLLFLLPLRHGFLRADALNWYYAFIHFFAALFTYWLLRDLRRSRAAAILGGTVFALGGYMGTIDWPQMLNGALWAPLVLLFFLRIDRGNARGNDPGETPVLNTALSGACLGFAFLSGHHQIPIFITLMMAALWIWKLFHAGLPRLSHVALAALFAVQVFCVSALQTLPGHEYWKLALRWIGAQNPVGWDDPIPYTVHAQYSFQPEALLGMIIPGMHGELAPFVGIVALTLACIAVIVEWRNFYVRLFAAIAIGGLFLSFGQFDFLHGIVYSLIPLVQKARSPAMAIVLFDVGIALLAGIGLDAARRGVPRLTIPALCAFAALLYFIAVAVAMTLGSDLRRFSGLALAAFIAVLLAALLYAWNRNNLSPKAGTASLVFLVMLELSNVLGASWPNQDQGWPLLAKMSENTDIVQFLKQRPIPVRIEKDAEAIPFNLGDWHGIDEFGGYNGVTRNVIRVQANYDARMLYGTNFYVGPKPLRDGQTQVFEGKSGLKVYQNADAFPRVWSVHSALAIHGDAGIFAQLQRPLPELARETFIVGSAPPLEACAGSDAVTLTQQTATRIVVQADLRCRAMVVVGQTYFPGWIATVDGHPAQIWEAYSTLQGVVADGGRRRIELRYRPLSVYVGAAFTAFGLFLPLAIFGIKRRVERPALGD